ncbi:MAG TPA: alpha/beta hydrolase family protein, partial [Planctomycetaceae bacterium]|nr:alpha/beta hydrolase family protein [Planctomycetaceae bacterium]
EPKDLNGYFPFEVPAGKAAWEKRSNELRRQVLVATGLWPMPERTPLDPVIHGKVQRDGFTVEKVYFESVPGHFVTGLLFRPDDGKTNVKRPAVLCPHGHGGRLQDHGTAAIQKLIESGDEKYAESGRFPKLARCAHLARMGCVTFIFDMLGYGDSHQISFELAHRYAKRRPEFETQDNFGLFSTQAELRLQSVMGIQTWNSIRCLDFLEQLPDVDGSRMAVTGGSGGGTQTILLCAIDPRPIAAFPNGMVSTSMQGGCTCENCTLLRVGTGNVELAALFAPRPQAMTAANDWTKEMMTKGYPELQQLYDMLGSKENVYCRPMLHFNHNYNYVSRATMYAWFNEHLKLGLDEAALEERDYRLLTPDEYTVWNEDHPQPQGGDEYERSLMRDLADASDRQLAKLTPADAGSMQRYRNVVGEAFQTVVGRDLPSFD